MDKSDQIDSAEKQTRKNFFKSGAIGIAAIAAAAKLTKGSAAPDKKSKTKKHYVMVIDLHSCTGCGACVVACKNENNVPAGFYWSDHITETKGKFPNVRYTHIPTLCNHCVNAPCVNACPVRAMHKDENSITMHDADYCIGCQTCGIACPYGVISFNKDEPHQFWRDETPLIDKCTTSGREVAGKIGGDVIPYYNEDRDETLPGIRPRGIVEKCTFCDHRLAEKKLPYCVDACPCNARIFGDLNDPDSTVSELLRKYRPFRLKEHVGTEPSVYYIRDFNPASFRLRKGEV